MNDGGMALIDDARACRLCPRACGVNRLAGEHGYCGAGPNPVVYRHAPHPGEEPPISGDHGSGVVFFAHCTMRCRYCQNFPWSQEHRGTPTDIEGLAARLASLHHRQCHNWNLVSPTPWLPWIAASVSSLEKNGIRRPIVYNSSGFETEATLDRYSPWIDIALVDLRYSRDETADRVSDCTNYVDPCRKTASWFHRVLGLLRCDTDGVASRGAIFRILVLPGHVDEACENLVWIAENLGTSTAVSLMSQYTPVFRAVDPPWNRKLEAREYDTAIETMDRLGFDTGWVQPLESAGANDLLGCRMQPDETEVTGKALPTKDEKNM